MEYPVWCLMVDGPLAGLVLKMDVTARTVQIKGDDKEPGSHCYRRIAFAANGLRVAMFKHTKTLVV